jgi:ribosomal protein S3AE
MTSIMKERYTRPLTRKMWYQVITFSLYFEKRAIFDLPARKTKSRFKRKIVISELKIQKNKQKTYKKVIGAMNKINYTIGF